MYNQNCPIVENGFYQLPVGTLTLFLMVSPLCGILWVNLISSSPTLWLRCRAEGRWVSTFACRADESSGKRGSINEVVLAVWSMKKGWKKKTTGTEYGNYMKLFFYIWSKPKLKKTIQRFLIYRIFPNPSEEVKDWHHYKKTNCLFILCVLISPKN